MLNRLKNRWAGFTRGDRIVLLLAEVAVFASCIAFLVTSSPMGNDWQAVTAVTGFVFVGLQFVVLLVVLAIASERKKTKVAPKRSWREYGSGWLVLLFLGVVYAVGGYAAEWMFPESGWATKWRYSLESDLKNADYVMERHPLDCNFLSAPIGYKHCHYDKGVATIRIRNGQSGREMSYDDGKSWSPTASGVRTVVFVSWHKVKD